MQIDFLPFPTFSQISVEIVAHSLEAQLLQEPCMSGELSTVHSFVFDNGLLKYLFFKKNVLKGFLNA